MTRFIRGFLVVMVFTIFGIGSLLLSFLFLPIGGIFLQGEKKREKFSHIIHKLWHIYTQFFVVLNLIKIEKHGVKQVKGKIIVATHPTLILIGIYDNSLCIAKKELLNNIFLKNIIKNVYIPNNIELDEFKNICTKTLNDGYNIIIFPTGTRTVEGEEIKIHKGSAAVQIASGADILPVKIVCDYPFLQKGKPIYDAGEKVITYSITQLEPIKLSNFNETSEIKLRNTICEKIKFDFTH